MSSSTVITTESPAPGPLDIVLHADDGMHTAFLAGRKHDDILARRNGPRYDATRIPAKILVRAYYVLHRESKIDHVTPFAHLDCFEVVQDGRSPVPVHPIALFDDIVSFQCGNGDENDIVDIYSFDEFPIVGDDFPVCFFGVADEIHFVDRHQYMGNLEQ